MLVNLINLMHISGLIKSCIQLMDGCDFLLIVFSVFKNLNMVGHLGSLELDFCFGSFCFYLATPFWQRCRLQTRTHTHTHAPDANLHNESEIWRPAHATLPFRGPS